MEMVKLSCSGSFKTQPGTDKDRVSFFGVEIEVPKQSEENEDHYLPMAMRMFPIAMRNNKNIKDKNFEGIIKLYVDTVSDANGEPLCAGKDIKEMNWEDLQSLACALRIREIPMYHQGSLRGAQEKSYELYQKIIKKRRVYKSPLDKKKVRERLQRMWKNKYDMQDELDQAIKEEMKKGFDMTINPQNKEMSYSFVKLPALVAVKSDKALQNNK